MLAKGGPRRHLRPAPLPVPRKALLPNTSARSRKRRQRARRLYGMLVLPGAEITKNHVGGHRRMHTSSPLASVNTSARTKTPLDNPEGDSPPGRNQHRLPSASSDNAPNRSDTNVLSLGQSRGAHRRGGSMGGRQPRRSVLGHQPQALSLRRQQRLPPAKAFVFVEDAGEEPRKTGPSLKTASCENVNLAITLYRGESLDRRTRAGEFKRTLVAPPIPESVFRMRA